MKSKDGCNEKKIMKENEIQLDIQINFQKLQMTEKILELNFKETYENDTCKCKGNCKMNHSNYNWKKRNGQELYSKLLNVNKPEANEKDAVEILKSYSCNPWHISFLNESHLGKHMLTHAQILKF